MFRRITLLLCYLLSLLLLISALSKANQASSSTSQLSTQQHGISAELNTPGRPLAKHEDDSGYNNIISNENSNSKLSGRDRLLFYTLHHFAVLSNFTVQHGTEVLQKVLKEAATLNESTDALKSHLLSFADYIARAEQLNEKPADEVKVGELYDMVVQFTELVDRYNTTAVENASTETLYLEISLKQNGLDKLHVDFLQHFLDFVDGFSARMDNYLKSLMPEQRLNERKMMEWYRKLNDETDAEKKVEIFTKFFTLYA
ncbi:PREDICTED: uncharacterized protein LOC108363687 [Rhagoletis zephyria]|uniref:uncharacterized protein LOC108363687 n=1 Tax=Rhagoletis zephyria TaxID=28612 RepID=UPI0008118CD5|nr:PREDICTED: uncharacterized protein LOC108363687 [Rhagoletis zephyria]XP_017472616.1 PREDICTED: uncharacterized protein LOC108363687 [Rhagoletis zephyria]XP_017472617.1 PREDICTED: uncharacterized protein LOC108363687 [Rhagoletis zephyria]XP_017472618.1 PREDICTED: uncharacterized protein LOC108363687 [Rhagoletis zephyria]XP_017472619.1 PREDICTED: uncharacterized protein LOC108363687 [Rhagoletis zephyria]